ncbi:MAG: D-alanine--D-alanine ligase [Candidatus Cloacimonadales bacterium]|nr:D-alanine--D-alanine ligase [Candidatus Cloacimonadales bacterium]
MNQNKLILVLSGGFSEEAAISKISASEIKKSLDKLEYETVMIDPLDFGSYAEMSQKIKSLHPFIVFNGLHGTDGEDGKIQALFELDNIPFSGSNSRSSALAMDKFLSGYVALQLNIKIPKRIILESLGDFNLKYIKEKFDFPIVVKPNDSGSSVGIAIIANENELFNAVKEAFQYSRKVLIENFIDGRELTVTILDGKALPVVEIKPQNGWYDFVNKYTKGKTIYETPAKLTKKITEEIQVKAALIFRTIGCSVYARVDFRFDGKDLYFLEVNTLPGMTPLSLTPMAAKAAGFSFEQLLAEIIRISLGKKLKDSLRRKL